jgi:carboxyl-terminal processing protease
MMNKIERFLLFVVLLGFGIQFAIGQSESITTTSTANEALPLDEIRTFTEVFAKVKKDYVVTVEDKRLLENAIRGMLEGLDPHSAYLDKEAYRELQEGTTGEFGGLGIEVGMENGFVKVIAPIDDTPAQKAGIQAGDLITRLDDTPVKGMTLNDAVKLMRGKPGTDITLTVVRENEDKSLRITITRDVITVKSVKSKTLEPGFGYVRISHFQSHTVEDLQHNLNKLKQENNGNLKGLILDLRNNPGGVLSAAVSVSDLFLDKGLIVYTEGRIKDSKLKFNAKPTDMLNQSPLIVLVNGGSASASEIVAGALQDNDRAIIMGEQTFGKGSVQTILPMANEAALKLTTARYYTPSGRSIQAAGITPDIIIENIKLTDIEENQNHSVKEADLSGHLKNDKDSSLADDDPELEKEEQIPLAISDYQLYEALNVLKGLAIQQKKFG